MALPTRSWPLPQTACSSTQPEAISTAQSVQSAASLSGWARLTGLVVAIYALLLSARSFVKVLNIVHVLVWGAVTPVLAYFLLRVLKATLIALQYKHKAEELRFGRDA